MTPSNPSAAVTRPDLVHVVLQILGDLAFMLTDDQPAQESQAPAWLAGEISYHGAHSGTLYCWCTREFATRLAANLLGIEADQGAAQDEAADAVREFLNVLCGQLVTEWHGRQTVLDLSIPTVGSCPAPPDLAGSEPRYACRLSVEGQPLLCTYVPHP